MADTISAKRRSQNMSKIRSRDTKPELLLRSALHKRGLRFRVCRTDLPGKPDIVFPKEMLAIQVRGCFWHLHNNCPNGRLPKSNLEYWRKKLEGNAKRDLLNDKYLREMGWKVMVIWECEMKDSLNLEKIGECIHSEVKLIREHQHLI